MPNLVVEIHVPLVAGAGVPPEGYQYPWIDEVEDFLSGHPTVSVHDDGEQFGDVYVFFIDSAPEAVLIEAARGVMALQGVPAGGFAVVTSTASTEFGTGRRVEL